MIKYIVLVVIILISIILSIKNYKSLTKLNKYKSETNSLKQIIEQKQQQRKELDDAFNLILKNKESLESQIELLRTKFIKLNQENSDNFERQALKLNSKYESAIVQAEKEYKQVLQDLQESINVQLQEKKTIDKEIEKQKSYMQTMIKNNKKEFEKKEKIKFFQLILSKDDINDIIVLRQLQNKINNKELLNKYIYKTYYENPYSALVGRVLGNKNPCGIYKITNLNNGMIYIGQSVNVRERWRQHIKRGVGADTPTKNKLYPAMLEEGIENYSFELVEECPQNELDEREQYWIDYYDSRNYGYNIR